ncbi:hypothetical protein D1871_09735 [Nakamurella silvestris]|nr:hypothetical protein D1871_09735 [Nakamurella silvestris]
MRSFTWVALLTSFAGTAAVAVLYGSATVPGDNSGHPNGCGTHLFRGTSGLFDARCDPAVYEPGRSIAIVSGVVALLLAVAMVVMLVLGRRRRTGDWTLPPIAQADDPRELRIPEPIWNIAIVDAVNEAKLDLAAGRRAIGTHDLLHQEATRLSEHTVLSTDPALFASLSYAQRLPVLEAELELWVALVGTLAYWGDQDTDRWWTEHITRFGSVPPINGSPVAIGSLAAPAVMALYAGGTAAVAAGRWELVAELITGFAVRGPFSETDAPVASTFGPAHVYAGSVWPSRDLARHVAPVLAQTIGLSIEAVNEAWERFEYLMYVTNTHRLKQDLPCYLARPCPYLRITDNRAVDRRKMTPHPRAYFTTGPEPIITILLSHGLFRGDRRMALLAMDTADSVISEQVIRSEMATAGSGTGYYAHSERRYPLISEAR